MGPLRRVADSPAKWIRKRCVRADLSPPCPRRQQRALCGKVENKAIYGNATLRPLIGNYTGMFGLVWGRSRIGTSRTATANALLLREMLCMGVADTAVLPCA